LEKFVIEYTVRARKDFKKQKKNGSKATQKRIKRILKELKTHPPKVLASPKN